MYCFYKMGNGRRIKRSKISPLKCASDGNRSGDDLESETGSENLNKLGEQLNVIIEQLTNIKSQIDGLNKKFNDMEKQYKERFAAQENVIIALEKQVNNLQRESLAKDIIINGLPEMANENLPQLFVNVCNKINFDAKVKVHIFRIKNNNSTMKSSSKNIDKTVIIKFALKSDKIQFLIALNKYRKSQPKKQLTLQIFNLSSDKAVYFHEAMTKRDYQVYRHALHLKSEGKIFAVYTVGGQVYAKVDANKSGRRVLSKSDLDMVTDQANNMQVNNVLDVDSATDVNENFSDHNNDN